MRSSLKASLDRPQDRLVEVLSAGTTTLVSIPSIGRSPQTTSQQETHSTHSSLVAAIFVEQKTTRMSGPIPRVRAMCNVIRSRHAWHRRNKCTNVHSIRGRRIAAVACWLTSAHVGNVCTDCWDRLSSDVVVGVLASTRAPSRATEHSGWICGLSAWCKHGLHRRLPVLQRL